jgi:hypothetical protein
VDNGHAGGVEVLAARAKSVSAKYYLLDEIDRRIEQYHKARKNLTQELLQI